MQQVSLAPTAVDFSTALYAFLDKLSPSMFGRLYNSPASCLSVFRLLPAISRHLVLNSLWTTEPLDLPSLSQWVREKRDSTDQVNLRASLSALERLHILSGTELHASFRSNLQSALVGGGSEGSFGVLSLDVEDGVNVARLDSFAEAQWETILHYMVGSSAATRPTETVLSLLVRGELMSSLSGTTKNLKITSKGFQFLLQEVHAQLWDLLLEYLEAAPDVVKVLGFLFMLGSLELGRAYSTSSFTTAEQAVLVDLSHFGLIYRTSVSSPIFYPTRLATTLTSSAPPLVSAAHNAEEQGFLIIETNYKIYAYTSNPLQIAVLALFVKLKSRFPNFVTGQITRDSIKRGLAHGITAHQIIAYLSSRAHPQMRKQTALVPHVVVDQILLWEKEGQRIKSEEGYLYDDFSSTSDYILVADYAKQLGVLLWELPLQRKMFVTSDGHLQVREFIKRRMAAAA